MNKELFARLKSPTTLAYPKKRIIYFGYRFGALRSAGLESAVDWIW
jgi:hypothetical protein